MPPNLPPAQAGSLPGFPPLCCEKGSVPMYASVRDHIVLQVWPTLASGLEALRLDAVEFERQIAKPEPTHQGEARAQPAF